jgi:16S rRNA processing protein RimM
VARRPRSTQQRPPRAGGASRGRQTPAKRSEPPLHLSPRRDPRKVESSDKIRVARIGAAHGVRGEVKLWPFTEDPMAVLDYGPLETEDGARQFEIESLRPAKDFLVARFQGIDDRDAAEMLRNIDLFVPRDRLPPIADDDTFYHADLVGLAAVTPDGAAFGTVMALHNFGAGDLIEIALAGSGQTLMLPFTETAVPEIDLKAKRIVVVVPEEVSGAETDSDTSP